MAIPAHNLHLYQKPALGAGFLKRLQTFNYRHEINANGWYDTASCDVAIRSKDEAQQFLDQYIGNRVAIYVDNPMEPCWEGFINRMTFSAGEVQYTISLDEMANRVAVQYLDASTSATNPITSANADNTASQAIYGQKHETIDLGYQRTVGTALAATRDTIIAQRAWPKASITRGGGNGLVNIEMLGFYHTLEWENYFENNTAAATLFNFITTLLLPAVENSTTFFDNTDLTDISANALTINRQKIRGDSIWALMQEVQEVGNATNYFVIGVTPTLYNTGTRRLYYRAQNTAIEYTARQSDGLRVRDAYGKIVPPWTVRPDRGIRISDMLIGWNGLGDNPAETWIKSISYDANRQTVDWQGDDDTTAEGVFQLRRYGKPVNRRFGATRRML